MFCISSYRLAGEYINFEYMNSRRFFRQPIDQIFIFPLYKAPILLQLIYIFVSFCFISSYIISTNFNDYFLYLCKDLLDTFYVAKTIVGLLHRVYFKS